MSDPQNREKSSVQKKLGLLKYVQYAGTDLPHPTAPQGLADVIRREFLQAVRRLITNAVHTPVWGVQGNYQNSDTGILNATHQVADSAINLQSSITSLEDQFSP